MAFQLIQQLLDLFLIKVISMFKIEADCQKQKGVFDKEDVSLSDAIFSTYPISPDKFQINWNGIPVNLTFNSISDIIDDVICMLDGVVIGDDFKCNFLCESFTVFFNFNVYLSMVEISSKWVSVNTSKEFFDLLNHDKKN